MSAYSDSDRTSRVMYGYVSEAARVPDMSSRQSTWGFGQPLGLIGRWTL